MPRQRTSRQKSRRSLVDQHSPFLMLPGEIRDIIYRHALISPTAIDLWPHLYHYDTEAPRETPTGTVLMVRYQKSLIYVRKQMATGLLGTCRQIYNEAAMYFWAKNIFRFSGRSGWQGLLRFLLTIGPQARRRIHRLDVHAPFYMRWPDKPVSFVDLNGISKNYPKMHMAKIPPENHLDTQAIQRVCCILAEDRTLETMNWEIPDDFRNGDGEDDDFGGYTENHYHQTVAHETLYKIDFVKITVVVEPGGYLAVETGPEQILRLGYNLAFLKGSFAHEKNEEGKFMKTKVTESRIDFSRYRDYEYLIGIDALFPDVEPVSVHANGGKHWVSSRKLERVLKGFGSCNFIDQERTLTRLKVADDDPGIFHKESIKELEIIKVDTLADEVFETSSRRSSRRLMVPVQPP